MTRKAKEQPAPVEKKKVIVFAKRDVIYKGRLILKGEELPAEAAEYLASRGR